MCFHRKLLLGISVLIARAAAHAMIGLSAALHINAAGEKSAAGENGMVFLIAGASHTGKTALAQRLLEKYGYPYLSIDHLKMGLIRSGYTSLTPMSSDRELTDYLWPVVQGDGQNRHRKWAESHRGGLLHPL